MSFTTQNTALSIEGNPMNSREESEDLFRAESARLPIRGPKRESTELHWVQMNPCEWLENLESKANTADRILTTGDPWRSHIGVGSFTTSMCPHSASPPSYKKRPQLELCLEVPSKDVDLIIAAIDPTSVPRSWNLQSFDPSILVDRIRKLVIAIEVQATFEILKPRFEQIREQFAVGVSDTKSLPQKEEGRFEIICHETIKKLQSLLAEAMSIQLPQKCIGRTMSPYQTPSMDHDGIQYSPTSSVNRAAFHSHMNNWLRANWINPYPDEAVSHQLAYETGENVHVVNTWLVNARSRRWRPAVLKAFELGRPSEYLLEDSINLFEDRPLRAIQETNAIESSKRARINLKEES